MSAPASSAVIRELQTRLARRLESMPAAHVQNKLMATTDRNLALALLACDDSLEKAVFTRIASRKADRVRGELAVMERRRVDGSYARDALTWLLAALEENERPDGRSSYWKPRKAPPKV